MKQVLVYIVLLGLLAYNVQSQSSVIAVTFGSNSVAGAFPVTITPATGSTSSLAAATNTYTPTTGTTFTAAYTGGFPLVATAIVENSVAAGGTGSAYTGIVTFNVGPQVAVTVQTTADAQNSADQTSAAAGSTAIATASNSPKATALVVGTDGCGVWYVDCIAGTVSVSLAAPAPGAGKSRYCGVKITQTAALFGGAAFVTSGTAPTLTSITGKITGASATTYPNYLCGTRVVGANTIYWFVAAASDVAAAKTGADSATGLSSLTSYATSFTVNLATSASAGLVAPGTTYVLTTYTLAALADATTNSPLTVGSATTASGASSYSWSGLVTPAPAATIPAANFKGGLPLTSTITFITSANTVQNQVVLLSVGSQTALSIQGLSGNASPVPTATTAAATALTASQTTSSSTSAYACGNYFIDCAAGTVQIVFNAPGFSTNAGYCVVTIAQQAAVVGGIAYSTAPTSTTTLPAAIQKAGGSAGTVNICGTTTVSGATVVLFTQVLQSTDTAATVAKALATAIANKSAFNIVTSRLLQSSENTNRMLATFSAVGGYANALPTGNSAGTTAPSTTVSSAITSNGGITSATTSANKIVGFSCVIISALVALVC